MRLTTIFLILIISASCSTNHKDKKDNDNDIIDTSKIIIDSFENRPLKQQEKVELNLNGIYEYVYPHNTTNLIENQYIAFKKTKDTIQGWYYGTSDEFDKAREGYLPGFFVSPIETLRTKGDSLFFTISISSKNCFSESIPIGFIDSTMISKSNECWNDFNDNYILEYSGLLHGLTINMTIDGESREYKKRKNYFNIGIDNFDKSKCQSEPLLAINKNINNLNDSLILDFLLTFSIICENNVEFSEWSNGLLFIVMDKETEIFIKTYESNINQLDTTAILKEIESPINDLIDIALIKQKILNVNCDEKIKNSIIKRLIDK